MKDHEVIRLNPLKACNTHREACTCYAIWSPGDGTAFAVGEMGTIHHWKNGKIESITLDGNIDFYDVHGFSPTDVWAVGTFGAVWHFDGKAWTPFNNLPTKPGEDVWFEAVWGRSSNDLYITGSKGVIFHLGSGGWTQLANKSPMRLYSIAGLDDGRVYLAGSFCEILLVQDGKVEALDFASDDEHISGIMRIPKTNRLLACGTNGTLLHIEGKTVMPIHTGVPKDKRMHFYGMDGADPEEVIIAGWSGVARKLNTLTWEMKEYDLGINSFIEGVARVGPGKYVATGWYGRIMSFDLIKDKWSTHQTGRAESTLAVALNPAGGGLASTDTGNLLTAPDGKKWTQSHTDPVDINVVASIEKDRFLLAGKNGYLAFADVSAGGAPQVTAHPSLKGHCLCASKFTGGAYLAGAGGRVFCARGNSIQELESFAIMVGRSDINAIAHMDDQRFAVRMADGPENYFVDLSAKTITKIKIKGEAVAAGPAFSPGHGGRDAGILFGGWGRAFIVAENIVHKILPDGTTQAGQNIASCFLTAGEKVRSGIALESGDVVLGGSKGTVIMIRAAGEVLFRHTGCYRAVASVDAKDNTVWAGLEGGRVHIVDFASDELRAHGISAPTYRAAAATAGAVVVCGDAGSYCYFPRGDTKAIPNYLEIPRDLLVALSLNGSVACLAGVETFVTMRNGKLDKPVELKNIIVTSICVSGPDIYLGTSSGKIVTVALHDAVNGALTPASFKLKSEALKAPVVDLLVTNQQVHAILEIGQLCEVGNAQSTMFPVGNGNLVLRRGAIPQSTPKAYVAGQIHNMVPDEKDPRKNKKVGKICLMEGRQKPVETSFPASKSISDVFLHGRFSVGDYWAGGTSGTLLIRANEKWYLVHTGIGNSLFSMAEIDERVVVCGEFGAIRFEEAKYLRDFLEKDRLKGLPAPAPESVNTVHHPLPHLAHDF